MAVGMTAWGDTRCAGGAHNIFARPSGCAIPSRAPNALRPRRTGHRRHRLHRRPRGAAMRKRGDTVWVWTRDADRALARFGPHVHVATKLADIPADARIDVVVNLAGAPVIGLPWTKARRQLLHRQPREDHASGARLVRDTRSTAASAGERRAPSASMGPPAMTWLDGRLSAQRSRSSHGLCAEREAAANAAEAQGIRAVNLRIGLVLGLDGGIFPQLALPGTTRHGARRSAMASSGCPGFTSRICCASSKLPSTSRLGAARSTRWRQDPNARANFSARWRARTVVRSSCAFQRGALRLCHG